MGTQKTEAQIRINNRQELPLSVQQILGIITSKEVNRIPVARIILKDGSVEAQEFAISDQDYFQPGIPIEILLGTAQEKNVIFKGTIIKHSIKVRRNKTSILIVDCKDETVRLTIGRKGRFFTEMSDSDIFQEIVGEYNQLSLETEDSTSAVMHQQIVQYYSTDWDFITLRAEAIGHYVFISDNQIRINPPRFSNRPVLTLSYGIAGDSTERSRIWEFDTEMDARHQFASVNTTTWDYAQQNLVDVTSDFSITSLEPGNLSSDDLSGVIGPDPFQLHHLGRMDEGELIAFANAVKQKSVLNKTRGRIKFDGRSDILPGDMVKLEGVGARFNGNVFVSRVSHHFEPGRWFTEIQFGLPYTWCHQKNDIKNPPAIGLLPKVEGLHVGKVIQLKDEDNPDRDFRIKVQIPGIHLSQEGVWARLASIHAGSQRGAVFLPELDDEVIIAYVGQDSRAPVILGALYSENNPPPFQNDDNNFIKGFVTKNNQKIQFDDENNTITIETQGGNTFVLDDNNQKVTIKDTNNNTIEMGSGGINFESQQTINIKAQNLNLEGLQTVNIKGNTATLINSPGGGVVKLGTGVRPASALGDPTAPPFASAILPGANTKVLI